MMTVAQVVKTSVTVINSPFQDYTYLAMGNYTKPTYSIQGVVKSLSLSSKRNRNNRKLLCSIPELGAVFFFSVVVVPAGDAEGVISESSQSS